MLEAGDGRFSEEIAFIEVTLGYPTLFVHLAYRIRIPLVTTNSIHDILTQTLNVLEVGGVV